MYHDGLEVSILFGVFIYISTEQQTGTDGSAHLYRHGWALP